MRRFKYSKITFLNVQNSTLTIRLVLVIGILFWADAVAARSIKTTAEFSDTEPLSLTLKQAETLFLEQNLILLAEKTQISIKEAEIRQARLWENPEAGIEHQVINRQGNGPVGFTGADNSIFEIEQLISASGKRKRKINLLLSEKKEVEYDFEALLLEYRHLLRTEFFRLAHLNRISGLFAEQTAAMRELITRLEMQLETGNVTRLEIMRLQGMLLEIEEELYSLQKEKTESETLLQTLLSLPRRTPVPLLPDTADAHFNVDMQPSGEQLEKLAMASRKDLLALQAASNSARELLRYEKAQVLPDIGVGMVYDRLDGPVPNYFGLTLNLQIPLWNRNQGGIQAARQAIKRSGLLEEQKRQSIQHELTGALQQYRRAVKLREQSDENFLEHYRIALEAVTERFRSGDVSLIEFVDFYESFRENSVRALKISENVLHAAENLNYITGTDIIKFNF